MNLGEPVCSHKSMTNKPIKWLGSQMTYWQSDQFIVPKKPRNGGGGKGLTVLRKWSGKHLPYTEMEKGDNKTDQHSKPTMV